MTLITLFWISFAITILNLVLIGIMRRNTLKGNRIFKGLDPDERFVLAWMVYMPGFNICVFLMIKAFYLMEVKSYLLRKTNWNAIRETDDTVYTGVIIDNNARRNKR